MRKAALRKMLAAEGCAVSASSSLDEAVRALRRGEAAVFPRTRCTGWAFRGVRLASRCAVRAEARDRGKPIAWLPSARLPTSTATAATCLLLRRAARPRRSGRPSRSSCAPRCGAARLCSPEGTIGLRMPRPRRRVDLIRAAGAPLATTSANPSGAPAPRCLAEVDGALAARAGAVVGEGGDEDASGLTRGAGAGSGASGRASTVLDCVSAPPRILREGAIPLSAIEALSSRASGDGRG